MSQNSFGFRFPALPFALTLRTERIEPRVTVLTRARLEVERRQVKLHTDFGLIAPMYAHLGRDPYPLALMQSRAIHVFRWVERMNRSATSVIPVKIHSLVLGHRVNACKVFRIVDGPVLNNVAN